MWSIGLLLFEMMAGKALWDLEFDAGIKTIEDPHFMHRYIDDKIDAKFNSKLKNICKRLLSADPIARPSAEAILKKKFLRTYSQYSKSVRIWRSRKNTIEGSRKNSDDSNKANC